MRPIKLLFPFCLLAILLGANAPRAATAPPLPMCLSEHADPCGRQIVARGSIEVTGDGEVTVYESSGNVLGAAAVGFGRIQVLMSATMSSPEYQVLVSGTEEVPSGRAPGVGRFDKWPAYFRITPASPLRSGSRQWIDFLVVGK